MNDALNLPELFRKADAGVALGQITTQERDAYLEKTFGSSDLTEALFLAAQQRASGHAQQPHATRTPTDANPPVRSPTLPTEGHDPRPLVAGFIILMIALFGSLYWAGGGITGAVVYDTTLGLNRTIVENTTIAIILDNTDRVTLTGLASGRGDITATLILPDGSEHAMVAYRQGAVTGDYGTIPQRWYTTEEPVTITARTTVTSATLLLPDGTNASIDPATWSATLPEGRYAVLLAAQDGNTTVEETLAFTVVAPGTQWPSEPISTCGDACILASASGEATLRVQIGGGATLTITDVILGKNENAPPAHVITIPDQEGVSVTIDLAAYFIDADGDALLYETSHPPGARESIQGSVVTITGAAGNYTYIAYASDLINLTQSNPFTVTLTGFVEENTTNETIPPPMNETIPLNETNVTIEPPINLTNGSAPTFDLNATNVTGPTCDEPDPNLRPEYCLNLNGSKYFEEDVFLESIDRDARARVTAIGNLLITGRVIPYTTATPAPRVYAIGYKDNDFNYIPTIWIDSEGNLHLRGTIHEENANLVPPEGSYALINRRGVYMLWADQYTGDLHIRGNVIPYRVSIYE